MANMSLKIGCLGAAVLAAYEKDLAAIYVVIGIYFVAAILDAIEYKINKLLAAQNIFVNPHQMEKDLRG